MKNINEALAHVQKHLKAPKNQFNKFGGYKYRSCEDILTGLKETMPEGASTSLSDDIVMVGDRFYLVATATFRFLEDSISVRGWARESLNKKGMDDSQLTGSCSSYARKYALNGLFSIDDSKDADTEEHRNEYENKINTKPELNVLPIVNEIVKNYSDDKWDSAKDILHDLTTEEKKKVWGSLSGPIRVWITSNSKG
jgi:hypothetical protein